MKEMKEIKCFGLEYIITETEEVSKIFDNGCIKSTDGMGVLGYYNNLPMEISMDRDGDLSIYYRREVPVAVRATIAQVFDDEGFYVEFTPYVCGHQFVKIYE